MRFWLPECGLSDWITKHFGLGNTENIQPEEDIIQRDDRKEASNKKWQIEDKG